MSASDEEPHVVVVQYPRSDFPTSKQAAVFTHQVLTAAVGHHVGVSAEEKE